MSTKENWDEEFRKYFHRATRCKSNGGSKAKGFERLSIVEWIRSTNKHSKVGHKCKQHWNQTRSRSNDPKKINLEETQTCI